jgi:integrase/recombinase XerD
MSVLADRLADYLALRRALGYRLVEDGRQLAGFVAFCDQRGEHTVTITTAIAWASSSHASAGQASRRLSMLRRFASYLVAFDDNTQIPPVDLLRAPQGRTTPYLYSPDEISALMAAARSLHPELVGATTATAIGLMAATGLRTGEVIALDQGDVDLTAAMLTVRDSKWHKSRYVPIHDTVVAALEDYRRLRGRTLPAPGTDAFLVSVTGARLRIGELTARFRGLRGDLGIQAPPFRRPPRLYDLRHSFAVSTLVDWHAAGVDVQARLPILSTYLGHLNPASTYWYLQAAPELLGVVAQRVARSTGAAT